MDSTNKTKQNEVRDYVRLLKAGLKNAQMSKIALWCAASGERKIIEERFFLSVEIV